MAEGYFGGVEYGGPSLPTPKAGEGTVTFFKKGLVPYMRITEPVDGRGRTSTTDYVLDIEGLRDLLNG